MESSEDDETEDSEEFAGAGPTAVDPAATGKLVCEVCKAEHPFWCMFAMVEESSKQLFVPKDGDLNKTVLQIASIEWRECAPKSRILKACYTCCERFRDATYHKVEKGTTKLTGQFRSASERSKGYHKKGKVGRSLKYLEANLARTLQRQAPR